MSCKVLEHTWSLYYDEHHREFRIDNVPHKFGATGSLGIVITDRPENLGITIRHGRWCLRQAICLIIQRPALDPDSPGKSGIRKVP